MPMYKVKLKNLTTSETQSCTVWAEDSRAAGTQSIKVARKLLRISDSFEIISTSDIARERGKLKPLHSMRGNGPVLIRQT